MGELLAVASGGAIGAFLRFVLSRFMNELCSKSYPWGIWAVNILGCFLMGIAAAFYLQKVTPDTYFWRTFLMVGLLGGFTTFSSFSLDTLLLLQRGELITAMVYVVSSLLLCLAATFCGFLMRGLWC